MANIASVANYIFTLAEILVYSQSLKIDRSHNIATLLSWQNANAIIALAHKKCTSFAETCSEIFYEIQQLLVHDQ
ncbi:hypothetical protein HR45_08945 [Shewanella mangrovi]|uniref:Uncharacterized protein n=1 Tax=Shewanella mangrovi TaxID=1515746 RepID=A0A094JYP3_9GAMM|nr:hypothetical protein HR45_08945 [Shewanella mangrovi]